MAPLSVSGLPLFATLALAALLVSAPPVRAQNDLNLSDSDKVAARYREMLINAQAARTDFEKPSATTSASVMVKTNGGVQTDLIPGEQLQGWIDTLGADGSWPDVEYHNNADAADWKPLHHLDRVVALATAYATPGNALYQNDKARNAILSALDYWLAHKFKETHNWWHNDIGIPQHLRDSYALMQDQMSADEKRDLLALYREHAKPANKGDSANTNWKAQLLVLYGAYTHDDALIAKNAAIMAGEVKTGGSSGFQDDFSFWMHGKKLQQFHYGNAYMRETIGAAWLLRDTPWAFPPDKLQLLADFFLKGNQWMQRRGETSPATVDRSISRPNALRVNLAHQADALADLLPDQAQAFKDVIGRQTGALPQLTGLRYFPRSNFVTYQRPGFAFFLSMHSSRMAGPEVGGNSEDLKGQQIFNGDHYLIADGREYVDLPPVWNWDLIPGVTMVAGTKFVPTDLVGCVADDQSGLAAMDYRRQGEGGGLLTARQAWAMHGDVVVCLIGDLTAVGTNEPVRVALDQSLLQGQPTVRTTNPAPVTSGTGSPQYDAAQWIQHGKFVYAPLQPSSVTVQSGPATGSWREVNKSLSPDPITEPIFLPILELGNAPAHLATGYVLGLASSPDEAAAFVKTPTWTVLRNDGDVQAVAFTDGTLMAAFYAPGKLESPGQPTLAVDRPCLLLLSAGKLRVSDPAQTGQPITVTHDGRAQTVPTSPNGASVDVPSS